MHSKSIKRFYIACLSVCLLILLILLQRENKLDMSALSSIEEGTIPIKFQYEEQISTSELNLGHRLYKISNLDKDKKVRFRLDLLSSGTVTSTFLSGPLNVCHEEGYFFMAIEAGNVIIVQIIEDHHPKTVVNYALNKKLADGYKTVSFDWFDGECAFDKSVFCFQFQGSFTDELVTVDANLLTRDDLKNESINGFFITMELVESGTDNTH